MNTNQAIKTTLDFTYNAMKMMLGDMTDADLLVRPVPGANHIAWQMGHLISSEVSMLGKIPGARVPELPAGFAQQHDRSTATSESPQGFLSKAEYLSLFDKVRAETLAALERTKEADFDQPTGWELAPNVGALFLLAANHVMMHAGQFTVIRRKLGKPVLF